MVAILGRECALPGERDSGIIVRAAKSRTAAYISVQEDGATDVVGRPCVAFAPRGSLLTDIRSRLREIKSPDGVSHACLG